MTDRINRVRTPEQIAAWEDLLVQRREWEKQEHTLPGADWWDFKKVANAATLLAENLPRMIAHWGSMVQTPMTAQAEHTVRELAEKLLAAMDYIEFPLGDYQKRTSKTPKVWYPEAVQIARHVRGALASAGHNTVGEAKNTIVASVVCCVLQRLGYGWVAPGGIHMFLQRYNERWGLPIG